MAYRESVRFGFVLVALVGVQLSCGDSSGPGRSPTSITANSSTSQTGSRGAAVAEPPSVIVRDQDGAPLSGASVTFAVTSGGGSVTGASGVTNSAGVATVGSWTLGAAVGANTLTASSGNLPAVTFTANGVDPCQVETPHTIGTTTNGELITSDCRFPDGSFLDVFGTTITTAGTYVFSQSSTSFDTFLILFLEDGAGFAFNDDFGTGTNSRIKAILPAGKYLIGANAFDANRTGTYTLTSSVGESVSNCEDVFVLRGVTSAQTLQALDCPRAGGFYADSYTIGLPAGQQITVSMNSSAVDSYVLVYGPSGAVLATNDDKDGTTRDAQLVFTAPADGYYRISASSAVVGATGAYTIIIQ
jgi:pre-peptidase